jgi:hypothetical protein
LAAQRARTVEGARRDRCLVIALKVVRLATRGAKLGGWRGVTQHHAA